MKRDAHSSITPLRPDPEVVHICIIDADPHFSLQLGTLLSTELPRMVNLVGTYEGIPEPIEVPHYVDLVIFDPELDDFRMTGPAVQKMRSVFGNTALLAVHADVWTHTNVLKDYLLGCGIYLGFRRYDLRKCMELVTKVALREPPDSWVTKFGT